MVDAEYPERRIIPEAAEKPLGSTPQDGSAPPLIEARRSRR